MTSRSLIFANQLQAKENIEKSKEQWELVSTEWQNRGWRLLSPEQLEPNWWNFNKMEPEDYDLLRNQVSLLQIERPIIVRPLPLAENRYQIIDGEHKWRACKELGFPPKLPCEIRIVNEDDAIELSYRLNIRGKKDPKRFCKLITFLYNKKGYTQQQLADMFNMYQPDISRLIRGFQKITKIANEVQEEKHLPQEKIDGAINCMTRTFKSIIDMCTTPESEVKAAMYFYGERKPEERELIAYLKRKAKKKEHPLAVKSVAWGILTCVCGKEWHIEWDTDQQKYVARIPGKPEKRIIVKPLKL